MNKISDKNFYEKITSAYDQVCQEYDELNILGIFATGLANYGYANTLDDMKLTAIYLPCFEELCYGKPKNANFFNIKVIDIRLFYDAAYKHSWNSLELLFTKYYKLNPIYEPLFIKLFLNNREEIGRCNQYDRILKARDRALEALEKGDDFEAMRLAYAAKEYLNGASCDECFHLPEMIYGAYLFNLREGKDSVVNKDGFKNGFNKMIEAAKDLKVNLKADSYIKDGIITIMMESLGIVIKEEVSTQMPYLTNKEREAFDFLMDELGDSLQGYVVLKDLIEKSNVSRSVYNNLFTKLKEHNIGEFISSGARGTKVTLFKSRIS